MKRVILDASVVLKWYLVDEALEEKALHLLESHYNGRIALMAPELLGYELASGLVIAARRGRIPEPVVSEALEGFWSLGIEMVSARRVSPRLVHWCRSYGLTAYDASYAALTEMKEAVLITADEKLYRAVHAEGGSTIRLQDLEEGETGEILWPETISDP